jgi:hypothetical protein
VQSFLTDHVNRSGYFKAAIKRANELFKFPPSRSNDAELQTKVSRFQQLIASQFVELTMPVQIVYAARRTKKRTFYLLLCPNSTKGLEGHID